MSTNKDKKKTKFVNGPEYPGGPKALTKFIYENLRYPDLALASNIEGTVLVEYDIDYQGKVVATRIVQGLGHGCDEEASRVVRLLKFDVGKNRDFRVLFHQKARIQFKKPQVLATPELPPLPQTGFQYNYQYVEGAVEQAPETVVYQYTISL